MRRNEGEAKAMSDIQDETSPREPARWWVVATAGSCALGALIYRLLIHGSLGHTALMFMGIPVVLTVLLSLTPQAKTVTGGIFKGITLALLIVAPLLGEGYLCILMASPIFYAVGSVVGVIVDARREKRTATLSCAMLVLLPLCFEGTTPLLTWHRSQSAVATQIVDATPLAMEHTLAKSMRVKTKLPVFLRIGFPRPLEAHGEGLAQGATRTIHFSGAEGDPEGDLVMRVVESRPGYARFETVSDGSKLTQWVRWSSSEVTWSPIDAQHTRVTWRIHFERQLDPAWYFTPWERVAVHEAAKFLIAANAVPESSNSQSGAR
jgi:hypothetical protein